MKENTILSRNPAIALGLCGFVAALANVAVTMTNMDILAYSHGFLFGVILAGYLVIAKGLSWLRALAIIILFTASWIAAFQFALYLYDGLKDVAGGIAIMSMLSGALGAIIVAIGFSIAYSKYFSLKNISITIIAGTIAALVLPLDFGDVDLEALWFVWQTAIGVSLGWDRKVFE